MNWRKILTPGRQFFVGCMIVVVSAGITDWLKIADVITLPIAFVGVAVMFSASFRTR